ncbi:MAG: sensor histidine kinase [Prevotella sp.]|nr:sensor histidine kinase [Prevotella sp.]
MKTKLKIRPYARLLTMLGEQLIKNEQIALAELIKNAYDADADWVRVSFVDFGFDEKKHDIFVQNNSKIIIEDNGCGMDLQTIEDSWMNPATPNKRTNDGDTPKITPKKHRIIQGEKGIGRFAILKLGRNIQITTRPENSPVEYVIDYNMSQYDDDFLTQNGQEKKLYIDNLVIPVSDRAPEIIIMREVVVNSKSFKEDNHHGTRIEISDLKGEWSLSMIKEVNDESQKLESIFEQISNRDSHQKIEIGFICNNDRLTYSNETVNTLSFLMQNSSVLKVTNGYYNQKASEFSYKLNGVAYKLSLADSQMSGLKLFREQFVEGEDLFGKVILRKSTCGDFKFNFFVFDFAAEKESPYYLDKKEKNIIRSHRIYLYRDKIRVAPYGDADDDWLEIDKKRGVGRAGDYLSNDQVVGFVDISKQGNPKLKDKTNREGLIEKGNSTKDFKTLLHCFLLFIRQHPYKQYQERINQQKEQKLKELRVVASKFDELKSYVSGNTQAMAVYNDLVKSYKVEQKFYTEGLNKTEDLAAVGLSVETASHDMSMMLNKGVDAVDNLIKDIEGGVLTDEQIENELHSIRGMFSFVKDRMRDIQLLFKSSKQRRRPIRINDLLEKVEKIYKRTLLREHIDYSVNNIGSPIIASCTDAVVLQLLINLFDNAVYWLTSPDVVDRKIVITLDGENKQLIFSDNGPGIREDDKPFIFEAFYSGKEDGRGLGLYIARQLLQRMGYSISLAEISSEKVLSGANFVINFVKSDDND